MTAATPRRPFTCVVPSLEVLELAYELKDTAGANVWPAVAVKIPFPKEEDGKESYQQYHEAGKESYQQYHEAGKESYQQYHEAERRGHRAGKEWKHDNDGMRTRQGDGAFVASVVEWMEKGCHATVAPLDGKDGRVMGWLKEVLLDVMMACQGQVVTTNGRKIGVTWRLHDGRDVGSLRSSQRVSSTPQTLKLFTSSSMSLRFSSREDGISGVKEVLRPKEMVEICSIEDIERVVQFLMDEKRGRIREDGVVSIVLYDEDECILSTLNFVIAKAEINMLPLISMIDEISELHKRKHPGDHILKTAQLTSLNSLAAPYLGGNVKIFIMDHEKMDCGGIGDVSHVVSVCSSARTLRTDISWLSPLMIPVFPVRNGRRTPSVNDDAEEVSAASKISTDIHSAIRGSSRAEHSDHHQIVDSKREEMQILTSHSLSKAAKEAAERISKLSSATETDASTSIRQLPTSQRLTGQSQGMGVSHGISPYEDAATSHATNKGPTGRKLVFPSLESKHDFQTAQATLQPFKSHQIPSKRRNEPSIEVGISRDVFSLVQEGEDAWGPGNGVTQKSSVLMNSSLYRNDGNAVIDHSGPSEYTLKQPYSVDDGFASESDPREASYAVHSSIVLSEEDDVHVSTGGDCSRRIKTKTDEDLLFEKKINENLLRKIEELECKLFLSEKRVLELESKQDSYVHVGELTEFSGDFDGVMSALRREVKNSRLLERRIQRVEEEKLEKEVELASAERELAMMHARFKSMASGSLSTGFQLAEDKINQLQEECRELKSLNTELQLQISKLETAKTVETFMPILPQEEDTHGDDAERRIILELNKKLDKIREKYRISESLRRTAEKRIEDLEKCHRLSALMKKTAQNATRKASHLQRTLDRSNKELEFQKLFAAGAIARARKR